MSRKSASKRSSSSTSTACRLQFCSPVRSWTPSCTNRVRRRLRLWRGLVPAPRRAASAGSTSWDNPPLARPIVALIGRPHTGKSTLFNRLIGQRKAIVDRQPGLTRDRLYGVSEWRGREFTVVDTAGLDLDPDDESRAAIERQTRVAVEEAQVIVFLLDAREGVTGID